MNRELIRRQLVGRGPFRIRTSEGKEFLVLGRGRNKARPFQHLASGLVFNGQEIQFGTVADEAENIR